MKNKKGFTLIEIIVTIALLGLIGGVIAINIVNINKKQENQEETRIESTLKAAAEAYVKVEKITENCNLDIDELVKESYIKESEVEKYKEDYYIEVNIGEGKYKLVKKEDASGKSCNGANKENYALKYDLMGGIDEGNNFTTKNYKYNDSVKIPNVEPKKEGYKFNGWSIDGISASYYPGNTFNIKKSMTLKAIWNNGFYNITYNKNTTENVTNMPNNVKDIEHNTLIHISGNIPVRVGYNFLGWSTSEGGEVKYSANSEYIVTNNLNLYAKWEEGIYTLTLDKQGGNEGESAIYEKYSKGIYKDSAATQGITKVNIPTKEGYEFKGYYESPNGIGKQLIDASGNITSNLNNKYITANKIIYAKWEAKPIVKISVENGTITSTSNATRTGTSTKPYTYYVLKGSNSNYSFKANEGYIFDSLQCSNSSKIVKQTSNTTTTAYLELGNVDNSLECTIKFKIKPVDLTLKVPSYFAYDWNDLQKLDSSLNRNNVTLDTNQGIFIINMKVDPLKLKNENLITVYGDKIEYFDEKTFTSMFDVDVNGRSKGSSNNKNFTCEIYTDVNSADYTKIKLNYNGSTYQNELSCDLSKFYIGYPIQINDYENLFGRGNTLDNIPIKKGYPDIYFIYSNKVDGINIVYRQLFESDFIKKDVGEFLSFYKILNYSNSLSNDYFKYYVNGNSIKLQINKIPKKLINFK